MGATQSTCVFFSTFSIALIAVDRYIFILYSPRTQITITQALLFSLMSFLVSALLASPLFMVTHLIELPSLVSRTTFLYCYEDVRPGVSSHALPGPLRGGWGGVWQVGSDMSNK